MVEEITFSNFITKGIETEEKDGKRIFKGHITAEIVDRQNEFIFVNETLKALDNYFSVMPIMTEAHSNRVVAMAKSWKKSQIDGHPSVEIEAEVFRKEGVMLYDKVWDKIIKKEYQGLSMGGSSKIREPMMKDGQLTIALKDLEIYEIAICKTPANPLAIIYDVNEFAKAYNLPDTMVKNVGDRRMIQCTSIQCSIEKGTNADVDVDVDNTGSKKEEVKKEYTLKVTLDTQELSKQIDDIIAAKLGGSGISIEKDKKDVKEAIEREHELLGEKPDKKEQKVHEQIISETKKEDTQDRQSLEKMILKNILSKSNVTI